MRQPLLTNPWRVDRLPDQDLRILGTPADDGLLRWDAHMLQWSCGYGLARWIESIDVVGAVSLGDHVNARVTVVLP